ncbi:DUF3298 and DUF4163 domain-containing protein [Aquimarina sp. M1]
MINTKPNTRQNFIFLLLLLGCFYGCQKKEPLIFQKRIIAIDDLFDCQNVDCAITEIFLIECIGENDISKNINREIEKAACATLTIEDYTTLNTIEEAIKSFNKSYQEIKEQFPDEIIPYEASIRCDINFINDDILSVLVDSYIFTGGAHGSGNSNFVNIALKTGMIINPENLMKDFNDFSSFVEKSFKAKYSIPENESINSTGFFFENNTFSLPSNIGFTDTHVVLIYNQYEISSYAEGPIELKFKKQEVSEYFTVNIL